MSFFRYLVISLSVIWCGTEVYVSVRKRAKGSSRERDRLSHLVLWIAIMASITFAILTKARPSSIDRLGRIPFLFPFVGYLGCLLMILGQTIRISAIAQLDKQFTVRVSIVEGHELIDTGMYGIVRHPAYLGTLTSFLGIGLALENWITLCVMFFLPLAATLYRIKVEEKALIDHFGSAYRDYARRTRRLVPGIY